MGPEPRKKCGSIKFHKLYSGTLTKVKCFFLYFPIGKYIRIPRSIFRLSVNLY